MGKGIRIELTVRRRYVSTLDAGSLSKATGVPLERLINPDLWTEGDHESLADYLLDDPSSLGFLETYDDSEISYFHAIGEEW